MGFARDVVVLAAITLETAIAAACRVTVPVRPADLIVRYVAFMSG